RALNAKLGCFPGVCRRWDAPKAGHAWQSDTNGADRELDPFNPLPISQPQRAVVRSTGTARRRHLLLLLLNAGVYAYAHLLTARKADIFAITGRFALLDFHHERTRSQSSISNYSGALYRTWAGT